MSDIPIAGSTSSSSGVDAMQAELALTSPEQSSQRTSPGQGQIVERDRSPRNGPAPSGVAAMFQVNREERGVVNQPTSYEANLATQTQNNQFVDESRNAQLNQQFVDARRLQFNVGVDPMIHQESIDALRQEAVETPSNPPR